MQNANIVVKDKNKVHSYESKDNLSDIFPSSQHSEDNVMQSFKPHGVMINLRDLADTRTDDDKLKDFHQSDIILGSDSKKENPSLPNINKPTETYESECKKGIKILTRYEHAEEMEDSSSSQAVWTIPKTNGKDISKCTSNNDSNTSICHETDHNNGSNSTKVSSVQETNVSESVSENGPAKNKELHEQKPVVECQVLDFDNSAPVDEDFEALLSAYTSNLLQNFWHAEFEKISHPKKGTLMSFQEALGCSILPRNLRVRQFKEDELVTITEALSSGQVDGKSGKVVNMNSGSVLSLHDAINQGILVIKSDGNKVEDEHMVGCLRRELGNGLVKLVATGEASMNTEIKDRMSEKWFDIPQAISKHLLSVDDARVTDTASEKRLSWMVASEEGLTFDHRAASLHRTILSSKFDSRKERFLNPKNTSKRYLTLQDMIDKNFVDKSRKEILDCRNDSWLTVSEAINENILDPNNNTYFHCVLDKSISFCSAVAAGLICDQNDGNKTISLSTSASIQSLSNDSDNPSSRFPITVFEAIDLN